MKSKKEYGIMVSTSVATSFEVVHGKEVGSMGRVKHELVRILMQADFDNINTIYENILDFFTRVNDNIFIDELEIEELARITQIVVNSTIKKYLTSKIYV